MTSTAIWAVVPVKELDHAKQRLAPDLPAALRRALALAMIEDVLAALATARGLAGILVVTVDPAARTLAERYGARCIADGARDGHTGAVTAAGRKLRAEGCGGMMTVPGDVPLVTAGEIEALLAAHLPAPSFTIAPSHDELGSNAIVLSPPDAVALRFGDDSFFPHLAAAEAAGIRPTIVRLPGIARDIDNPVDLAGLAEDGLAEDGVSGLQSRSRTGALLAANAMALTQALAPLRRRGGESAE